MTRVTIAVVYLAVSEQGRALIAIGRNGPDPTGKSHLSLALGVQVIKAGRSVYFTPLSAPYRSFLG